MSSRRRKSYEDDGEDDERYERKKHKKSKKSSKDKHKDKDRGKSKHSDKDRGDNDQYKGAPEPELTAIEKFNMFKKQREAAKSDEGKVVDDLFKDFIASKIKQIEGESVSDGTKEKKSKSKSKLGSTKDSVSELSKFLDNEISNIPTPPRHLKTDDVSNTSHRSVSDPVLSQTSEKVKLNPGIISTQSAENVTKSEKQTVTISEKGAALVNVPLPQQENIKLPLDKRKSVEEPNEAQKADEGDKTLPVFGPFLPRSLAVVDKKESKEDAQGPVKKTAIGFKNFGIKLSATSAELIQSGEIHKKGKRLEDGEVLSSSSGDGSSDSDDDDDDDGASDGEVSGTGSINDDDNTKKSKKKKKKKGKHKKKKKNKDKDKEKDKEEGDVLVVKKDKAGSKRKVSLAPRSRSRSPKRTRKSKSRSLSKEKSKRRSRSKDRSRSKIPRGRHSRHSRSRSRSRRSRSRGRRSRSRGRRSRSRGRRSRSKGRRSRSRSPDRFWRSKYGDFDAFKFLKGKRDRDRSRSRSPDHERDRFIEKERKRLDDLRTKIDKAKLREFAIQTALNNAKTSGSKIDVTIKAGGKSVEELTEYCKKIQEKESAKRKHRYDSSSEDEANLRPSDDDDVHHPFQVKEAAAIKMDIPNSKQLPLVSAQERLVNNAQLRLVFPVSSGSQHRDKEWVPVEPTAQLAIKAAPTVPNTVGGVPAIMPPPPKPEVKVFEEAPEMPVDISAIVSERLSAVRKLQENPNDLSAKLVLNNAQKQASQWAQSKNLPGKFIGSTGATIMSAEELMGDKKRQAWLKKDVFTSAAPVSGGIGMFLLQKMGWKHGEGLGKNNEGLTEPLMLDFKVDRKGLVTSGEGKKSGGAKMPIVRDLSGKHPVSALGELCNKRRWGVPHYELVHESGPSHKKDFLFKVKVNNHEYQPSTSSNNKKLAKAQAASVCLQELGLVPRGEIAKI